MSYVNVEQSSIQTGGPIQRNAQATVLNQQTQKPKSTIEFTLEQVVNFLANLDQKISSITDRFSKLEIQQ